MMIYKKVIALILTTLCLTGCLNKSHKEASEIFTDPQVIALAKAAKKGDTQTIDQLLNEGVDIDTIGEKNLTPLSWLFLMNKDTKNKKIGFGHLVQRGASTLIKDDETHQMILHLAAQYDEPDYLEIILEKQPNVNLNHKQDDSSYNTPLLEALFGKRYENFVMLVEHGADIEKADQFGNTPLVKASSSDTWKFAYFLLQRGADYTVGEGKANLEGKSDIVWSLENYRYSPSANIKRDGLDYREKVIAFLSEKGVEVNPWYPEGYVPAS